MIVHPKRGRESLKRRFYEILDEVLADDSEGLYTFDDGFQLPSSNRKSSHTTEDPGCESVIHKASRHAVLGKEGLRASHGAGSPINQDTGEECHTSIFQGMHMCTKD